MSTPTDTTQTTIKRFQKADIKTEVSQMHFNTEDRGIVTGELTVNFIGDADTDHWVELTRQMVWL